MTTLNTIPTRWAPHAHLGTPEDLRSAYRACVLQRDVVAAMWNRWTMLVSAHQRRDGLCGALVPFWLPHERRAA